MQSIIESSASTPLSAQSPSFTTYSSENLADIAARVVHELNLSNNNPFDDDDDFFSSLTGPDNAIEPDNNNNKDVNDNDDEDDDDNESEFEFAVLVGEDNSSPISADEIFYNGQIKPVYPIFNTDLVYGYQKDAERASSERETTALRLPLRKLMIKERENVGSSSSSEGDELEGVPEGTYCVWAPKKKSEEQQEMMKKKSSSTGSLSKRWRIRDLLYRSNSDGKDAFVFLTPSHNQKVTDGGEVKRKEKMTTVKNGGKRRVGGNNVEGKKKSYLPYRQDLVGLFASVHGVSRTVRPF